MNILVAIPTYNNAKTLGQVIDDVRKYTSNILVINDGSTDNTNSVIKAKDVNHLRYKNNKGKGHALHLALKYAIKYNYSHLITIDSDGQHFASDIPKFIDKISANSSSIIIGARNLNAENMPSKNTFGNKFSNFWFFVETGNKMADTQSGFRLYPVKELSKIKLLTKGYEFEVEIIVKGAWRGIGVENIPIKVYYAPTEERVSHFKPFKDFTKISILNSTLVLQALLFYYPWKFIRSINKKNIKNIISNNITNSPDSNLKVSGAIGLGIFFGIIPLWGYQMICAAVTAHFFKLNKILTLLSSNISIPPMIPFILYGSYVTGGIVLNRDYTLSLNDINLEKVSQDLFQYIIGSIVFAFICSIIAMLLSYLIMLFLKRKPTIIDD